MTLKTEASSSYGYVTAANAAAQSAANATVQAAARDKWVNVFGVVGICAVTSGTPTVINLNAATTADAFAKMAVGEKVDIGTVAQIQAGSGTATTNNTITAQDSVAKTITLTSSCGRAITVNDFVVINGIWTPINGQPWTVNGQEATITVEGMEFRFRNTSPSALEVKSAPSAGVTRWLPLTSIADLGTYLAQGEVV